MLRLIALIILIPAGSLWAEVVQFDEAVTCQSMTLTPKLHEMDFKALERFTGFNCAGFEDRTESNKKGYDLFCPTHTLTEKYLELRKEINEGIGDTISMDEAWSLSTILSGAFQTRFVFSTEDILQKLLDYAVVRAALYQKVNDLKKLYPSKRSVHTNRFDTCTMPRIRAFLSGESLAAKHWNYHVNVKCHEPISYLRYSYGYQTCEAAVEANLYAVQKALQKNSFSEAISIYNEAEKNIGREELAQIQAYITATRLSSSYSEILGQDLEAYTILSWLNNEERYSEISADASALEKSLNNFAFEINEADILPFDIRDDQKVKLALFAVLTAEMKDLRSKVSNHTFEQEVSLHTAQEQLSNNMVIEFGQYLQHFLEIYQKNFNPGLEQEE